MLRQELANASDPWGRRWGGRPPIFRIHTDATPNQLAKESGWQDVLSMHDVVVDTAANLSVALTFHRMVVADALVMSRSSLSQAAGLLRTATSVNQSTLFPGCWRSERRRHPMWRDFSCDPPAPLSRKYLAKISRLVSSPQQLRSVDIPTGHYQTLVAHLGLASSEDLRNSTRVPRDTLIDLIRKQQGKGGRKCLVTEGRPDSFRNLVIKADSCLTHSQSGTA